MFAADYAGKTADLTQGEDGAYLLLLLWQYHNRAPIPVEKRSQYRIAKGETRNEKRNIDAVVGRYFETIDGGLWNRRAYQEVKEQNRARRKMSEAGRKGGRKRWGTPKPTPQPTPKKPYKGLDGTRARPDPEVDQNQLPIPTSEVAKMGHAENGAETRKGLTPEQRAEAERIQASVLERRRAEGVGDGGPSRAVAHVAPIGLPVVGKEENS